MDCRTARLLVPFARPGVTELERADLAALKQHLADCPDCRLEVEAERTLDAVLSRAMRAVPVPASLRDRLLAKLGEQRRRVYARWAVRGLTAAAGLLLTCLIIYKLFPENVEELLVIGENASYQLPVPTPTPVSEPVGPFRGKQEMLDHLREQGCSVVLPRDLDDNWDFRLLKYATVETYEGKPVATLVFKKGAATAKVRLLRWGQYDRATIDILREGNDPRRRVVGHPLKDEYIALVELSDDARIEDFCRPKQTVA
jgi:hypothetical protein